MAWFVASPFMALLLLSAALLTARLLLRRIPSINRTVSIVEANRSKPIDGLRGLLGISVFIHHTAVTWFYLHGSPWRPPPSRFMVHLGQTSVALFFMITAFLFWGRVLARGRRIDWAEFFVSRLYRLYPIYLVMFAFVFLAVIVLTRSPPHPRTVSSFKPVLQWALMFGTPDLNGLPDTGLLVAGVTWSLRYEWLFYASLPCLGFALGGTGHKSMAMASLLIAGGLLYRSIGHGMFEAGIVQAFLGGIVAAYWVRNPALVHLGRARLSGLVAVLALLGVVTFMPTARNWAATFGLTIFFVAVASGQDLGGLLRRPALLWLGEITYGIYLLHGLMLWLILRMLLPHALAISPPVFLIAAIVIAALIVLVCSVLYLTIERPAIMLGKRHYAWLARAAEDIFGVVER